jgi:hypothetical protein
MAKPFNARPATPAPSAAPAPAAVSRTDVRNSPLPKATSFGSATSGSSSSSSSGGKKQITNDQIARRAYEIWQSGKGGSDFDNWVRAERELRGS